MRIAILGGNGFVGSSLVKYLEQGHFVKSFTRQNIDMLDPYQVRVAVKEGNFDVVVNSASVTSQSSYEDVRNDLGIFINFYSCSSYYKKFINLSSGAELDRSLNLYNISETALFDVLPADSYGFVQNTKSRICFETEKFYTLRIFNCFGRGEIPTRIFPRFLSKTDTLEITNDRYFDYFSIQDLCRVVEQFILNDQSVKDVNCVYLQKFKISEVLEKFCKINNLKSDFSVTSTSQNNYTGSGALLAELDFNLIGLDKGLEYYLKD